MISPKNDNPDTPEELTLDELMDKVSNGMANADLRVAISVSLDKQWEYVISERNLRLEKRKLLNQLKQHINERKEELDADKSGKHVISPRRISFS